MKAVHVNQTRHFIANSAGGAERLSLLLADKPWLQAQTNWRQAMVIRYLGFDQATISRTINGWGDKFQ